jgi:spermidine synthase
VAARRFAESPAPGVEQAYEAELLHAEVSSYQQIEVYEHPTFGRMLVLDDAVQTSERDEFLYHEMLVHVPLVCHPAPRRVLVVGGGDGGSLRRALEHPTVEEVVMVEIDERVVAVSRAWLPGVGGSAWDDPRARVLFGDGAAYVAEDGEPFDVIIVDSSDPVGPGAVLFETPFYRRCAARLAPGGLLSAQIGYPLYSQGQMHATHRNAREAFAEARVYLGPVLTYPGVLWAYLLAGERVEVDEEAAAARAAERGLATRYWTPAVHRAAFALPGLVAEALGPGPPPDPFAPR